MPIPSADVSNQVEREQQPQQCSSYSLEPVHEYTEVEAPSSPPSSTDEQLDEDSYDLEVRPIIRTDITPFVTPNDRILPPDVDPKLRFNGNACTNCGLNDEVRPFVKCSYSTDGLNFHITDCIVSVESYIDVQYFCSRDDYLHYPHMALHWLYT